MPHATKLVIQNLQFFGALHKELTQAQLDLKRGIASNEVYSNFLSPKVEDLFQHQNDTGVFLSEGLTNLRTVFDLCLKNELTQPLQERIFNLLNKKRPVLLTSPLFRDHHPLVIAAKHRNRFALDQLCDIYQNHIEGDYRRKTPYFYQIFNALSATFKNNDAESTTILTKMIPTESDDFFNYEVVEMLDSLSPKTLNVSSEVIKFLTAHCQGSGCDLAFNALCNGLAAKLNEDDFASLKRQVEEAVRKTPGYTTFNFPEPESTDKALSDEEYVADIEVTVTEDDDQAQTNPQSGLFEHLTGTFTLDCLSQLLKSAAIIGLCVGIGVGVAIGATVLSGGNVGIGMICGFTGGALTLASIEAGLYFFNRCKDSTKNEAPEPTTFNPDF